MVTDTIAGPTGTAPARTASRRSRTPTESFTGRRTGPWMTAPFMVLYLLFLIGPLIYGIVMSFFNSSIVHSGLGRFAGVSNYREALTDSAFWQSMWHTVLFTIFTTPPLVILAFVLALLTERIRHGRWFYRFAFFAPYVVPSAAVVLIWLWIYTPAVGLATKWLSAFGITAPNWLGSADWGMISVSLLTIWWTIGFNFILYLAALQEIPREIYDAASVDGASGFATMWRITLPLVGRTTALVIALQIIASLKVFDQIYLLLSGGPNLSTRPALEYVYDVGFTDYRAGYAAAASMIYFLAILLASIVWLIFSRVRVKEEAA
ncbi:MAG TPA: sugar ABC transporter permease [Jatrophihabitantaceae bacterium]|jgi:multiple sugar transport system permease protein|nr:sugar ABC transporter permease [Jatrophihabitantaceae bacterium]